jgi:hypothetical protein
MRHGAGGVYISNHGGRSDEEPALDDRGAAGVVEVVSGRVLLLIDSGFGRGSDIFKVLALGADDVGVGRPWGLAAFGQEGVDRDTHRIQRASHSSRVQHDVAGLPFNQGRHLGLGQPLDLLVELPNARIESYREQSYLTARASACFANEEGSIYGHLPTICG